MFLINPMTMGGRRGPPLYRTDFSEYASFAAPSDWTKRFVTGTWEVFPDGGSKFLGFGEATSSRRGLSWNVIPPLANYQVLIDFLGVTVDPTTAASDVRVMGRGIGGAGNETCYAQGNRFGVSNDIQGKYVTGTFTTIATGGGALVAMTRYWMRVVVSGTNLKMKIWAKSGSEPGSWTLDSNDSSITAGGWIGLFAFGRGNGRVYNFACTEDTVNMIPLV